MSEDEPQSPPSKVEPGSLRKRFEKAGQDAAKREQSEREKRVYEAFGDKSREAVPGSETGPISETKSAQAAKDKEKPKGYYGPPQTSKLTNEE